VYHSDCMLSAHARVALQLRAIVAPYRDPLLQDDPLNRDDYRQRAARLLEGLENAAAPYPDLEAKLAEARAELGLK